MPPLALASKTRSSPHFRKHFLFPVHLHASCRGNIFARPSRFNSGRPLFQACWQVSPVTAAGPQRLCTVFPFKAPEGYPGILIDSAGLKVNGLFSGAGKAVLAARSGGGGEAPVCFGGFVFCAEWPGVF